jgi:hypothetical protein
MLKRRSCEKVSLVHNILRREKDGHWYLETVKRYAYIATFEKPSTETVSVGTQKNNTL